MGAKYEGGAGLGEEVRRAILAAGPTGSSVLLALPEQSVQEFVFEE